VSEPPSLALITDNPNSWSVSYNLQLVEELRAIGCTASLVHAAKDAPSADIALYLNCERIVPASERARFGNNLIIHASDLPKGRGWSPMTWQILEGQDRIALTMFEAADAVDSGPIYFQSELRFEGHELIDEMRTRLALASNALVMRFVRAWPGVVAHAQEGEPTFYGRRRPNDSKLDVERSLRENFPQLRVADNERYPAFFEHAGHIYELRITKRGPIT
jgi:methionyl-tRNA formyltransferase